MRVAYAGDWHANTRWAIKAIEYAQEQGADEIPASLRRLWSTTSPKKSRDGVEAALVKANLKLLVHRSATMENLEWLLKQPTA